MQNHLSQQTIPFGVKIATLGPETSFSKKAASQIIQERTDIHIKLCRTMDEVRKSVTDNVYGLLPRVNYSSGIEAGNVGAFYKKYWIIRAETGLAVEMCIGGLENATVRNATHIHSKDVAIAQCDNLLEAQCPEATWVNEESTGIGAEVVAAHQSKQHLAIASEASLTRVGLKVLLKGASNCEQIGKPNITQFTLVAKANKAEEPFNEQKTMHAMVITPANKRGVLEGILSIVANHGMDLEDLHSSPYEPGHFRFLIIMRKDTETASIKRLVQEIQASIQPNSAHPLIKPLGSWNNIS